MVNPRHQCILDNSIVMAKWFFDQSGDLCIARYSYKLHASCRENPENNKISKPCHIPITTGLKIEHTREMKGLNEGFLFVQSLQCEKTHSFGIYVSKVGHLHIVESKLLEFLLGNL